MSAPRGHPRWGGRKKGTPNKDTAEWKLLFDGFDGADHEKTKELIERIYKASATEWRAADALLDRRYGAAGKSLDVTSNGESVNEKAPTVGVWSPPPKTEETGDELSQTHKPTN